MARVEFDEQPIAAYAQLIWEHDAKDDDLIVVRYLGTDPFGQRRA